MVGNTASRVVGQIRNSFRRHHGQGTNAVQEWVNNSPEEVHDHEAGVRALIRGANRAQNVEPVEVPIEMGEERQRELVQGQVMLRPDKVEKVVSDIIFPPGAGIHYFLWTTADILTWLEMFCPGNEHIKDAVLDNELIGIQLYHCFLDPATSQEWLEVNGIKEGIAMKVSMVLGRLHNIIYRYE